MTIDENAILERVDALRGDILDLKEEIKSIKKDIIDNGKIFGDFQVYYTREHARLEALAEINKEARINHEARLKILEDLIKPLIFQSKIVAMIGGSLLLSVLGLLWAIFTH